MSDPAPNAAWAVNAVAPKKKPTLSIPLSTIPPPPAVAPPKRNSGMAFSMEPGLASQETTSSPVAPVPAPTVPPPVIPPPKRNNGMAFSMETPGGLASQPPTSSPFPPTPLPASVSSPFLPYFHSVTAQQHPPTPSPAAVPFRFLPMRPAPPIPADPPAPQFLFDELYQRTTEEMDSLTIWIGIDPTITWRICAESSEYPYPWLLTAWHALCSSMGTYVSRRLDGTSSDHRSQKTYYILLFSILYTVNIAVSNVSLGTMTIPDHQVIRSTIPIFIIILSILLHRKPYPLLTMLTLLPLTTGVILATRGSLTLSTDTMTLGTTGALLSALKTLATHHLQTAHAIPALAIMRYVSPLAGIQATIWSYMNGEIDEFLVKQFFSSRSTLFSTSTSPSPSPSFPGSTLLLANGTLAFLLNWSSFTTNRHAGALSMAVLGNIKQVLAIAASLVLFRDGGLTGCAHLLGVVLALGGGFLYSWVEVGRVGHAKRSDLGCLRR
ncbi:hypothetical protein NHQ30_002626 [Ciborinia camelliae]|nr:hypothetical protein NHQ30_002626 [Ciborinia camelliae]